MSTPEHHLEIETKLDIDAGVELPDLLLDGDVAGCGVVAITDPVLHELDAGYWDTQDLRLLGARITLRRRTGGTDEGWHLKLPPESVSDAAAGTPGARTEIRLPLGGTEVPAAIRRQIAPLLEGRPLIPVATLCTRRTVRVALDERGTALVEIADDVVTASRPDGHADQWREVEVELLDGSPDQLAAVTRALVRNGARPTSRASKLGRALRRT